MKRSSRERQAGSWSVWGSLVTAMVVFSRKMQRLAFLQRAHTQRSSFNLFVL
jgi:hypothetical protein